MHIFMLCVFYLHVSGSFHVVSKCCKTHEYVSTITITSMSTSIYSLDAVTIVLFKVLGAFANRPFDANLPVDERVIGVGDVSGR